MVTDPIAAIGCGYRSDRTHGVAESGPKEHHGAVSSSMGTFQEFACARRCHATGPLNVSEVRNRLARRVKTARRNHSLLLQLPKDVFLRIALEVACNSACLDDICTL